MSNKVSTPFHQAGRNQRIGALRRNRYAGSPDNLRFSIRLKDDLVRVKSRQQRAPGHCFGGKQAKTARRSDKKRRFVRHAEHLLWYYDDRRFPVRQAVARIDNGGNTVYPAKGGDFRR